MPNVYGRGPNGRQGKVAQFWFMLRVVQLKKLYTTDFDPVLL